MPQVCFDQNAFLILKFSSCAVPEYCDFPHEEKQISTYRGRDRMVVGFMTTYTISAYHY